MLIFLNLLMAVCLDCLREYHSRPGMSLFVSGTQVSLEDSYNPQIGLDVFKEDPNFQDNEKKYEVGQLHYRSSSL